MRLKKPATLLKVTLRHGCFSRSLNCTVGTKSRKTSQININRVQYFVLHSCVQFHST